MRRRSGPKRTPPDCFRPVGARTSPHTARAVSIPLEHGRLRTRHDPAGEAYESLQAAEAIGTLRGVHDPRGAQRIVLAIFLTALAGCSSSPPPESVAPPPVVAERNPVGPPPVVVGASDSVGAQPGSPNALFRYRFRQIDPSSDRFTFQDRDLNFYFKPSPDAIHFNIENRQDRPIEIEWDRSQIVDAFGKSDQVAHASTKWTDRFASQPNTIISGLQRYGDYVFPISYLVDPAGSPDQLHRPVFAEDSSAPQYADRTVTVSLSMKIEGQSRPYAFTFRVESVISR